MRVYCVMFVVGMLIACDSEQSGRASQIDPDREGIPAKVRGKPATTEADKPTPGETAAAGVQMLGNITATLNGEQRTWYVTRENRGGRWISESDQSFRGEGTVFFSGHVSNDSTTNPVGLLTITVTVPKT